MPRLLPFVVVVVVVVLTVQHAVVAQEDTSTLKVKVSAKATGDSVADARVRCTLGDGTVLGDASSNGRGQVKLTDVPRARTIECSVDAAGYEWLATTFTIGADARRRTVRAKLVALPPLGEVRVSVVSAADASLGVAGARVVCGVVAGVDGVDERRAARMRSSVHESNGRGVARVDDVREGDAVACTVDARDVGYTAEHSSGDDELVRVVAGASSAPKLTVHVEPRARVAMRVVERGGTAAPLADVAVRCVAADELRAVGEFLDGDDARTDAAGALTLLALPLGSALSCTAAPRDDGEHAHAFAPRTVSLTTPSLGDSGAGGAPATLEKTIKLSAQTHWRAHATSSASSSSTLDALLASSSAAADTHAGESVALSADGLVLAVGEVGRLFDPSNVAPGRVRVFERDAVDDGAAWRERLGGAALLGFGAGLAVALSADGERVVVGSPGSPVSPQPLVGGVRVFEWRRRAGEWRQLGDDIGAEQAGDGFGATFALSADGNTLAVGARGHDAADGRRFAGLVRVLAFDAAADTWVRRGADVLGVRAGDALGSVALSADGERVVVGAPLNDGADDDAALASDLLDNRGSVRVFDWHARSGEWRAVDAGSSLLFGDAANDEFGRAVTLSDDGRVLVVGAPGAAQGRGRVRVLEWQLDSQRFERVGASSSSSTTLVGTSAGAGFGGSLALAHDSVARTLRLAIGNTIGAAVRVVAASLAADVADVEFAPLGQAVSSTSALRGGSSDALSLFGYAVTLSSSGAQLFVGAPNASPSAERLRVGAVHGYSLRVVE